MIQDQEKEGQQATDTGVGSALHRKTATGRAEHQARSMTLARALRLSIAKVADDLLDMAMATLSLKLSEVAGPDLLDFFDDEALLILLDGSDRRNAAVIVDPSLVGSLIQQQTMGQVLPSSDADARMMTGTDAAIVAPFLDAVLSAVGSMPDKREEKELIAGYSFGAHVEEGRLLHLSMSAQMYHVVQLELDVERGARQGRMVLCLPVPECANDVQDLDTLSPDAEAVGSPSEKQTLGKIVPALEIALPVVLSRQKVSLRRVSDLKVGDLIALPDANFQAIEMCTPQGKRLGIGSMGQIGGRRAIRMAAPGASHNSTGDIEHAALSSAALLRGSGSETEFDEAGAHDTSFEATLAQTPTFEAPDLPDLPDQPEMPDMSDIPDFDDLMPPEEAVG